MPYKEYTKCVEPGDFVNLGFTATGIRNIIIMVLLFGIAAFLVIVLAGGPVFTTIIVALVATAITYLRWWLYGRLICLNEKDRNCAIIGAVISHGPSDPLKKSGDNDHTMNILLAPGPFTYDSKGKINFIAPLQDYWDLPQGYLSQPNQKILNIPRGYVQDADHEKYLKFLHCEFEGSGIRDLLNSLYILLPLLAFAMFFPPPANWILALIALLIAIISFLSTIFADQGGSGSGTPLDVDASLGDLAGRDIVIVKGEWIYDSLHAGWNEIHPIRTCQKIGRFEGDIPEWSSFVPNDAASNIGIPLDTPENVKKFQKTWCGMLHDAEVAEEGGNREEPFHDWVIHPLIDGCKSPTIIL